MNPLHPMTLSDGLAVVYAVAGLLLVMAVLAWSTLRLDRARGYAHRPTDPICARHRHRHGRLSRWWQDRRRGQVCRACQPGPTIKGKDSQDQAKGEPLWSQPPLHIQEET